MMSESTLPDEGTANDAVLSADQGDAAIANLLDGPETAPDDEDQGSDDESLEESEAEEEVEDTDSEEAPEEDENVEQGEDEDAPEDEQYEGGRFAADSAKVTLKDGSTVSVEELKRGYISRQYLTRETQALSEQKKAFETQYQQVNEFANSLNVQRDFLFQAAQHFLPQPPDKAMIDTDFLGYQRQLADYQEKAQLLGQLQQNMQSEQTRVQQEQTQAQQNYVNEQATKLVEIMPEMKNPAVYNKFWSDTLDVMADYGFTPQDLEVANDHRFFPVFKALMELKRIKSSAPKVKQKVQSKPLMKAGKRMDPKAKLSREKSTRMEQLRKTGSAQAAEAALMDLDL